MKKKRILVQCKGCGNEFTFIPWQKRKYCSRKCYLINGMVNPMNNPISRKKVSESKIGKPRPDLANNPNHPFRDPKVRAKAVKRLQSPEVRQKISNAHRGRKHNYINGMQGRCAYDIWLEKYGKIEADKRRCNANEKRSIASSKSRIRQIQQRCGQIMPNYNPAGCIIIDWYNMYYDLNFQHAENGGEYHIKELGYFVDGYDKEKNIVIEIDERHHFDSSGNLRECDVQRQRRIENLLKCEFIRIKQ